MSKLQTTVKQEGQAFLDEPVYRTVSRPNMMVAAVAAALESPAPMKAETITHHERVRLRWLKPVRDASGAIVRGPDGKIKLKPR